MGQESKAEKLYWAIVRGESDAVESLIRQGADIHESNPPHGGGALYLAVDYEHLNVVEVLLNKGARVNQKFGIGRNIPLNVAVKHGNSDIVNILIAHDSDVNNINGLLNETPLYTAVKNGCIDIVKSLCKAGGRMNLSKGDGGVPLIWAARKGDLEAVKILLAAGVSVHQRGSRGQSSLYEAVCCDHSDILRMLLLESKFAKFPIEYSIETLPYLAAKKGHIDVVKVFLEAGLNVNEESEFYGKTPLYGAASNGHHEIVKLLINQGLNVPNDVIDILYNSEDRVPIEQWVVDYFFFQYSKSTLKKFIVCEIRNGLDEPIRLFEKVNSDFFWQISERKYPWLSEERFQGLLKQSFNKAYSEVKQDREGEVVKNSVFYPERNKVLTLLFKLGQEQVRQESLQDKADSSKFQIAPYKKKS